MLTYDDLVNDLASGCKPRALWRIGVEHEQFAFDKKTGGPLAYEGRPGIRELLEVFSQKCGWEEIREGETLIALRKDYQTLTLEPGGQVEFSGSPLPTLREVRGEMDSFYKNLNEIASCLGIGLVSMGVPPEWRRADMHWMPKERYAIMRPYMEKKGNLGVDMMARTCGAQVNLDFSSEADMVKKFRVALALQPLMVALMANSSRLEGAPSGYASYRAHIWTDTDPDRCGFLPFVFDEGMSFARYVDYALDVPMYFIRRGGRYIDVAGQSFRAFMDGKLSGHEGEYPSFEDWHDHFSTLFPDVRLKHYLEMRGPDSNPPDMVYAMAAFWTGLLYDSAALEQAYQAVMHWPMDTHAALRTESVKHGMEARVRCGDDADMYALARSMLTLAQTGLLNSDREKTSRDLLEPLWKKADSKNLLGISRAI